MVDRNPTAVKHPSLSGRPFDLAGQIRRIEQRSGLPRLAMSFTDFAEGHHGDYRADEWFHAASTIKVAIMVALFALEAEGELGLDSGLLVENRFRSMVGGLPYRLDPARDSCPELYRSLGEEVPVRTLIHHMIVSSSNLATNLLLDGPGAVVLQRKLLELGLGGVELLRGVEDEAAFEQGHNNRVTASGLHGLFTLIWEGDHFSPARREEMLEILFRQKFTDRIPMGLPEEIRKETRFAHKTGEISSVIHDAGLVFLPERQPYCLVILTETGGMPERSQDVIREMSRLVYQRLIRQDDRLDPSAHPDV